MRAKRRYGVPQRVLAQVRRHRRLRPLWYVGPLEVDPRRCPCGGFWRGAIDGPYAVCNQCGGTKEDPAYS